MSVIPLRPVDRTRLTRMVDIEIDGQAVSVPEGTTILNAAKELGIETPVLCYGDTLTPVNVCRLCVVELEGSRVLVPACSRKVEPNMVIKTDSERVRHSRKLVLELLGSSVDMSWSSDTTLSYFDTYTADTTRFGAAAEPTDHDSAHAGHHQTVEPGLAATVTQPAKIDNELYIRDYSKCILCYKCVEACGTDAQNTFAIAIAGRGFDTRVSTEFDTWLPDSACVYCGNCIAVCPTGALVFTREYELRNEGNWRPEEQTVTDTICPYCGVGCTLSLYVQDNEIVKALSPMDHDVTLGNLCVKGRFGWQHVQEFDDKGGNGGGDA